MCASFIYRSIQDRCHAKFLEGQAAWIVRPIRRPNTSKCPSKNFAWHLSFNSSSFLQNSFLLALFENLLMGPSDPKYDHISAKGPKLKKKVVYFLNFWSLRENSAIFFYFWLQYQYTTNFSEQTKREDEVNWKVGSKSPKDAYWWISANK